MKLQPWPRHKTRKYQRGENPCGSCNLNQHKTCRPRLDGTLCSCSCERAAKIRAEVELYQIRAEAQKKPMPPLMDICLELGIRSYRVRGT